MRGASSGHSWYSVCFCSKLPSQHHDRNMAVTNSDDIILALATTAPLNPNSTAQTEHKSMTGSL